MGSTVCIPAWRLLRRVSAISVASVSNYRAYRIMYSSRVLCDFSPALLLSHAVISLTRYVDLHFYRIYRIKLRDH